MLKFLFRPGSPRDAMRVILGSFHVALFVVCHGIQDQLSGGLLRSEGFQAAVLLPTGGIGNSHPAAPIVTQNLVSMSAEGSSMTTEAVSSDAFGDIPFEWMQNATREAEAFVKRLMPKPTGQHLPASGNDKSADVVQEGEENIWRNALTSVQCTGPERNRSCAFKNLYFNQDDGGFFVFSLEDTVHPDFNSVMLLSKWSKKGRIQRRDFASLADFRDFMEAHRPRVHEGLSLIYDTMWHFNIGYSLWEGLYPAFLSLVEWGRQGEKFRSVVGFMEGCSESALYSNRGDGKCMSEGAFKKFGGGEYLPYYQLNGTGWHCFSDSVAGSGRKGYRSINREYDLPGGRGLDGARLFRDRMYTSHGLPAPKARASSSMDRSLPLRGIIVANGRFTDAEVEMLKHVANKLSSNELQLQYVDYRAGALAGNFTKHLELIETVTFHISGPGTAQSYVPLLPDGSVHMNLGDRRSSVLAEPCVHANEHPSPDHFISFIEENWAEGVPYVRALYYDPLRQKPADLQQPEVTSLIRHAVSLVQSGFALPVAPGANLSPVARVFTEYCSALGTGCDNTLSQLNGDHLSGLESDVLDVQWCFQASLAEHLVFENGGWSEAGKTTDGVTEHCLLDRALLRQIRARHFGW